MIRAWVLGIALMAPLPAFAHNVISAVFPSGSDIEGEVGFSNGEMAPGLLIEVFDQDGGKLGETRTDDDGFFVFTPAEPVTHIFRGNLGAGHVAEAAMDAAEVAQIMGKSPSTATPAAAGSGALPLAATAAGLSDQARAELAAMLRNELRPLRQELTAFKNKSDFQSVLGGIGYIFGLFGLGFYIAARRKMGNSA
ncbi:cobalt ABC transporter permease [Leisingera daeponensis]|uniref:Cobalt ABC transporter permease n=1 Tax=Leisingera daeponensis TaxID=405746 RepID=A0ABS7NLD3_9RHOB|nr:cobalt ABC transporter permease [Leisingera daeponensis]MBY6058713.1 cobalt ABC transporter permease [Leisingera daeponensis]MBY6140961.1 cobalt ABC transporter permease [Leisingera daeponensis]